MNSEDFTLFVASTLDDVIQLAEENLWQGVTARNCISMVGPFASYRERKHN